jgi:hypothetical protein|nr:MAG TPA: hypothetical protein [Caudoviricetes sp.]
MLVSNKVVVQKWTSPKLQKVKYCYKTVENRKKRVDVNLMSALFSYRRKFKMELKDTIELMNSKDYKERFKAEYLQAKIRYDKLDSMTVKYEAGTLNFTPSCSLELLKEQKKYMGNYIRTLRIRAEIENIELN